MSFQPFERLYVFVPRDSGLKLISAMRLDYRKDLQSVKSVSSILYLELKADVLPPLVGNNVGRKTNAQLVICIFLIVIIFMLT